MTIIATKTPIRITFFGGSTDYPNYFLKNNGHTLGMSIDKYSYIFLKKNFGKINNKFLLSYRKIEKTDKISNIKHISIKSCLNFLKIKKSVEIHYASDLPAKTGLGSSSSFTVGLLKALYCMKNIRINNFNLAKKAIFVEQKLNKEKVGCQDQITCAVGGLCEIIYTSKGIFFKKLKIKKKRLNQLISRLMLFYTGKKRESENVLLEQTKRTNKGLNHEYLKKIKSLVPKAISILKNDKSNINEFGRLMHVNWQEKKKLSSKISDSKIDKIYNTAIQSGALGGKIIGAGAGGFLLFFVPLSKQNTIKRKLRKFENVKFKADFDGSKIIFK
jgi:D-glycero-alpha-D-manno-heptose-7-phosphate kinase